MFSAYSSSKNGFSARCPSADNIVHRDDGIFETKTICLTDILQWRFLIIKI
jgi:hypothetical protein